MKILAVSGKAGSGKDYTAEIMKKELESRGKKVLITHYADLLKYLCRSLFDWDGKKDEKGRHLLQYVGTEIVRNQDPDFWVDFLVKIFTLFNEEWDFVIIPDCRFPNEINKLSDFDVTSVRITRPGYENGLTEEAKNHLSEIALDDYRFDYTLVNCGTENYNKTVSEFIDKILSSARRAFEHAFNEKIDAFKNHSKYDWLRQYANEAIGLNKFNGKNQKVAEDFMNRIITATYSEIKDWLDCEKPLDWTSLT